MPLVTSRPWTRLMLLALTGCQQLLGLEPGNLTADAGAATPNNAQGGAGGDQASGGHGDVGGQGGDFGGQGGVAGQGGAGEVTPADWALLLGPGSEQMVNGVAVDAAGNAIVVGAFSTTIEVGCTPLNSTGALDGFIAKFSPEGACLWALALGDGDDTWLDQTVEAVAVTAKDRIVVVGTFDGDLALPGGPTLVGGGTGASDEDVYVLELDALGSYIAHREIRINGACAIDVAADMTQVVVAGGYRGDAVFLGDPSISFQGGIAKDCDAFVVFYDSTLTTQLVVGGAQSDAHQSISGVALNGPHAAITGTFSGVLELGETEIAISGSPAAFVGQLSTDGDSTVLHAFGTHPDDSEGSVVPTAITYSADGDILVAGTVSGPLDLSPFGGATLPGGPDPDATDAFALAIAPTGSHQWSNRYGETDGSQSATTLAALPGGGALVGGVMSGTIAVTAGTITASPGTTDGFVLGVDADGAPDLLRQIEAEGAFHYPMVTIAADPLGGWRLAGSAVATSIDVGDGPISGHGGSDVFLGSWPAP